MSPVRVPVRCRIKFGGGESFIVRGDDVKLLKSAINQGYFERKKFKVRNVADINSKKDVYFKVKSLLLYASSRFITIHCPLKCLLGVLAEEKFRLLSFLYFFRFLF